MPYDELGNYVPGDEPSIDDMRLALAKSNPSGRRQETEAEYKARMVNQLPPAFGVQEYRPPYVEPFVPTSTAKSTLGQVLDRSGITALPQAAAAVLSSYPSAIAKEMGYDKAAQALQYEPTSKYANEMVERLGHAMEAAKVPAYVAHVPMARPYMTPNDVRVLGANVAKTAREIRDIPADFVNAQSGFKRQDIFGQPTLGTRLQGGAESIGDLMARREMQGLSAVPGIPASIVPETKMYAVRPANYGQIIEQSDLPGKSGEYASGNLSTVRDIIEDIRPPVEGGNVGHKLATYERNFFSPIDGLRETMRQLEFAKIKEMYPDAPTEADAIDAYRRTRNDKEQIQDKLNWYDEFKDDPKVRAMIDEHNYDRQMIVDDLNEAKMEKKKGLPESQKREIDNRIMQLEEELRRKPVVDVPSMAEYERRIKAADRYLNTEFKNEIKKYIGTSEGTMMNLAKKGITFKPAEEILEQAADVKRLRARSSTSRDVDTVEQEVAESRQKAGFNPKGETFPMVESAEAKFNDAQTKVNDLSSQKFALREQHLLENPDIPDPAQNPGPLGEQYRALTNKIESASSARDKAKKELDNFRLANAYELLSDYAYVPMTAGYLKEKLPYAERATAFPNLAKTPDEAPMFNVRETMINDAMGLKDAGDRYAEAIVRGDIPLDKNDRPTKTLDKFIEESTDLRRRKEDLERALESRKVELLDSYSKDTLNKIPDDLKFGNAAVLELTNKTPFEEVRRQISYDGSVFDHCVAATDAPHAGVNPYTGQRYSYSFPVDPATGLDRTTKSSSYMEQVKAGNTMISSLRDKTTGLPAGTIELKNKDNNGTYKVGYVSSHKNDPISAEYRNDLRDYLNKRSDIIRDVDSGMAALYKSGVYDTRGSRRQLENIGLSSRDIEILQNSDHPRFITSEDMARLRTESQSAKNSLTTERENIAQELADAEDRLVRWREMDPDDTETHQHIEATIDDYRSQLQDIDQRIARQNVPAVQGERLPSNEQIRNGMTERQATEVHATYRYITEAERFADDYNWDHEGQMNAINAIRNDPMNLNQTVLHSEDIGMIQTLNRNQRELLARELEQNFIVNMEHSLDGGVVSLADFEGEVPGITRFYEDAQARARGELANPEAQPQENLLERRYRLNRELADAVTNEEATRLQNELNIVDEQLRGNAPATQDNLGNGMVLQAARNNAFGTLDDFLRQDAQNIVDMATFRNPNDLPAIRQAVLDETNSIFNGQRFNHLDGDQQLALIRALNNFANEIAPGNLGNPADIPQPTLQALTQERERLQGMRSQIANEIANETDENLRRPLITQRNDVEEAISRNRRNIEHLEELSRIDNEIANETDEGVRQWLIRRRSDVEASNPALQNRPINPRNNPELVNFDQHTPAVTTDLNQALQDSLESARGLHPQSSVNAALDALNDISNDIDLTDNPTEFINRVRGRSDNSRGRVSSILSSVADDIETAIEAIQPQQPERRVRRVRGEPGSLTRVMNHAIDQLTNENTGSMQAYTSFMNELEGGTRGMIEASLRDAIALTGDRYSELAMQRFNVDSPAGVHQLNRAFNYTFENLPQNFAAGGLVRRFKDGGQARNTDNAGYSTSLRMWEDAAYDVAPDDPVRGAGDAARHIIASGDMTRRYGRVPAAIAGYGHEFLNLIRGEQTVDDFLQDIRNNALGRDIGANAKSFEDVIAATKESLSGAKPYEKIPGKAYIMKTGKYMDSYKDGGSVSIDEMRYEIMKGK